MRTRHPSVEILSFAGCPNSEPTVALARKVVAELGLDVELREISIETLQEAESEAFVGSPSVRVNGRDIEMAARGRTDFALSCRMYGKTGVPAKELLVEALRKAISG